ncbi:hypothetical protein N3K66_002207 [Trichothecium roseum]|uniref:Uncharacterized protein n=1 Tax=Trichothecium roseum TaxID=47278 RepID=A0ACC0VAW9_9HYPO|nr:hypothetical protein N3K66_002207 [Trichothecium roseum]
MLRSQTTRCLARSGDLSRAAAQVRRYSSGRVIQEHDVLLIRQRGQRNPRWHLTAPLRLEPTSAAAAATPPAVKLSYGATLSPRDLVGRRVLDQVTDSTGRECVLHDPSMSSYIMESERMATPIYPHDASMIVSMLDLNLDRPGENDVEDEDDDGLPAVGEGEGQGEEAGEGKGEKGQEGGKRKREREEEVFEIFEAGTGMGSLTLHMARAIHAGNPPLPAKLRRALASAKMRSDAPYPPPDDGSDGGGGVVETVRPWDRLALTDDETSALRAHLDTRRRAVLHTLDNRRSHALAAHRFVRGFRRAQYLSDVDFHVGRVSDFVRARLAAAPGGGRPFLSRCVLDLARPAAQAEALLPALKQSALVLVFQPSISQIASFAEWAPPWLRLERTVELPPTGVRSGEGHDPSLADSGGGRVWDLRSTVVKSGEQRGERVTVMRPKVGEMLGGGGFVGVWRVWPEREGQREAWEARRRAEAEVAAAAAAATAAAMPGANGEAAASTTAATATTDKGGDGAKEENQESELEQEQEKEREPVIELDEEQEKQELRQEEGKEEEFQGQEQGQEKSG